MHSTESPFLSPAATAELSALEGLWGAAPLRCALPHAPHTAAGRVPCSGAAVALFRYGCQYRPALPGCESAREAIAAFLDRFPAARCPGCPALAADCWGVVAL